MSMRINTNLDALTAQRNLATTGLAYSKSVAKLSSGMRINSAADDAAGLTISEKLRAQSTGLGQASKNAQDGISLIQTGEGALNETASILQRMRELTVQGGNDTLQATDRGAIKSEMDQLSSEIDRIANTTQFNGKTLLNGTLAQTTGANASAAGGATIATIANIVVSAGSTTATGTGTLSITALATSAALASTGAAAGGVAGTLSVNGIQVSILASDTGATAIAKINTATAQNGVVASGGAAGISLRSNAVGTAANVSISASTVAGTAAANNAFLASLGMAAANGTTVSASANGVDATASNFTAVNGMASDNGNVVTAKGNIFTTASGMKIDVGAAGVSTIGNVDVSVNTGGSVSLQIGANAGQTLSLSINKMDASVGGLNVSNLDVSSSAAINDTSSAGTLTRIDAAIASVSNQRATLGAYQNRLEHTISNLGVSQSNLTASESRIRDVDMAAEMVNFTKTGILQQAGQAILAQANQSGSGVMSLLR